MACFQWRISTSSSKYRLWAALFKSYRPRQPLIASTPAIPFTTSPHSFANFAALSVRSNSANILVLASTHFTAAPSSAGQRFIGAGGLFDLGFTCPPSSFSLPDPKWFWPPWSVGSPLFSGGGSLSRPCASPHPGPFPPAPYKKLVKRLPSLLLSVVALKSGLKLFRCHPSVPICSGKEDQGPSSTPHRVLRNQSPDRKTSAPRR